MFKLLFIAGLVYFFYRITTKKIDVPRDIYVDEDTEFADYEEIKDE